MILKNGFTMKIKANVVPNINGTIEKTPFRSEIIKQTMKQYELADTIPVKKESCNIDLLIGNDYYADIVSTKRIMLSNGLYLFGSKFGLILSGRTKNEYKAPKRDSLTMLTYSSFDISTNFLGFSKTDDSIFNKSPVEDFWALETFHGFSKTDDSIFNNSRVEGFRALETVGIKDPPTINDDIKLFRNSINPYNW